MVVFFCEQWTFPHSFLLLTVHQHHTEEVTSPAYGFWDSFSAPLGSSCFFNMNKMENPRGPKLSTFQEEMSWAGPHANLQIPRNGMWVAPVRTGSGMLWTGQHIPPDLSFHHGPLISVLMDDSDCCFRDARSSHQAPISVRVLRNWVYNKGHSGSYSAWKVPHSSLHLAFPGFPFSSQDWA